MSDEDEARFATGLFGNNSVRWQQGPGWPEKV